MCYESHYGYDKQTMTALAETADKTLDEHNVVIDYDGEVDHRSRNVFPYGGPKPVINLLRVSKTEAEA